MAQVFVAYILIQLFGIGQITIMCQNNAKRRADIERLGLCAAACIAGSRIADMCDAGIYLLSRAYFGYGTLHAPCLCLCAYENVLPSCSHNACRIPDHDAAASADRHTAAD